MMQLSQTNAWTAAQTSINRQITCVWINALKDKKRQKMVAMKNALTIIRSTLMGYVC
jgi:hypothetical protein